MVSRIKRQDKQSDIFSGKAYMYRSIMTDDGEMSNKEVTSFYNQRGSSERTFDAMNSDFGWSWIYQEHRLVYEVFDKKIIILSVKGHYL